MFVVCYGVDACALFVLGAVVQSNAVTTAQKERKKNRRGHFSVIFKTSTTGEAVGDVM
jgi:hypothetical protein